MKKAIYVIILICGCSLLLLYLIPICFPRISTKYSENFDINIYNKIEVGDKRRSVEIELGKPLYISKDNTNLDSIKVNYWYSKNNSILMEYEKIIIQFYDDKVIKKTRILDGD